MEKTYTTNASQFDQLYSKIIDIAKEKQGQDREKFITSIEAVLTSTPKKENIEKPITTVTSPMYDVADYIRGIAVSNNKTPIEVLGSVETQMRR